MKKTWLILLTVFVCLCLSACGKSLDMEKLISSPVKEAVIRAGMEETRITEQKIVEEVVKAVKNSVFRPASASAYDAPGAQTLSVEIITETGSVTITYPYFRYEDRVYDAGADSTKPFYAIMSEAAAAETVSEDTMKKMSEEAKEQASEEAVLTSAVAPTGYPKGQVQRQFVFYRGVLWCRDTNDGSMKDQVPAGFTETAAIVKNDNYKVPTEELFSAQMAEGLKIYSAEQYPRTIYIEEAENRYQRYVPAEGTASDWNT